VFSSTNREAEYYFEKYKYMVYCIKI